MSGFKHVCLLNDNAPSHTSDLVKQKVKEGNRLITPIILSGSSPMLLFLFSKTISKLDFKIEIMYFKSRRRL